MSLLDWLIPSTFLAVLLAVAWRTSVYGRSVAGFLAGNRCAGRYLLCVSHAASQVGVITLVWFFQQYYDTGFTSIWWGFIENPVMILVAITGWVAYRFRETRALTLAQFLEIRYSRAFRIFCGVVAFIAGLLNYAIFPAVTARFIIAMTGIDTHWFPWVMGALLTSAVTFVFLGGQITVIVCDFLQGIVTNVVFLVIIAYLLSVVGWSHIALVLVQQPVDHSMTDPLGIAGETQFNVWYWLISAFTIFYTMRAWQGGAGYNAAALTPHEAKMASVLEGWRWRVLLLVALVVPICVKTILEHPDFATIASGIRADLAAQPASRHVMLRIPTALGHLLPAGLLGLMLTAMYGSYLAVDNAYLHSWASIGVQDVVLPIRSMFTDRPLAPRVQIGMIYVAVLGVAVFAFVFGLRFESSQYIAMWATITGSVFVAGAGSVIIGGLYWRRGSTTAAWSAMIVGISLSIYAILAKEQLTLPWFQRLLDTPFRSFARATIAIHDNRWLSGQVLAFLITLCAIGTYVIVSLRGWHPPFNLDRMLYRGRWRELLPESERVHRAEFASSRPRWLERLGFTREFNRTDTVITWITVCWPLAWTGIFVVGTVSARLVHPEKESWIAFWHWYTWLIFGVGCGIVVWFSIGGFRDLHRMFAHLRRFHADARDDGSVPSSERRAR